MSKFSSLFLHFFLLLFASNVFAARDRYPTAITAFSGGATYCEDRAAQHLSVTISTALTSTAGCNSNPTTNIPITVTWYSNIANATSGGTVVYTQNTTASAASLSFIYVPPTTPVGTLYYYAIISWNAGSCAAAGSLTTATTQTVIINTCTSSADMPNPPVNLVTVPAGSLVIPMDNSHQNLWLTYPFNIKAYGLVNALLQNDIPVKWVIKSGKVKDSSDFSAMAARVYPTAAAAALQYFKSGEFIIDTTWLNKSFYTGGQTATQVISAFANLWKVAVYKLSSNTVVDVRYTLNHRPKIACFNNGTYQLVSTKLLDSAKISNYVAISAGVFTGLADCYTFCNEMHWSTATLADSATMRPVWDFINEGGNFLAQCAGENAYENFMKPPRRFETTGGTVQFNPGTLPVNNFSNPDMAFNQFEGTLYARSGTTADWNLAASSSFTSETYNCVTSVTKDTIVAAATHFGSSDSVGGNVFYLGGHDYLTTNAGASAGATISLINGQRMFLNAALVPAHRPTSFFLDPGSNKTICAGQQTTIGGPNLGYAYTWSPATGLNCTSCANPIASPTVTTAYTVIAFNGSCQGGPSTMTVTVNPTPSAPAASSNSPVCMGSTLSLTASTVGVATYSWNGPNSFTSTSQNPTITNVTTSAIGTYSVIAVLGGCSSSPATTSVSVSAAPGTPTASSNGPVCQGVNLSLTASNVSGATYSWNGPNSFTSALQNPTISSVTTLASGTYSVTAIAGGCAGSAGTVSVTINPTPVTPVAGSNSTVCSGGILSLTASSTGTTYAWNGPNSFTSANQNPSIGSVTTLASGTYSVIAAASGCTSSAGTVTVTINQTPVAPTAGSNSPICEGINLSLTASSTGATYNWTGPNSFTSSSQNPVIVSAGTVSAGTYSVTASSNGCTSTVATTSVVVNPPPSPPVLGSNSPVCSGQTLSLAASTLGGATYSWTGPNSFSSILQNPTIGTVSTAASGTYSMTATVPGCPSLTTITVSITINQTPSAPVAGSNSPVCVGGDLSLTASGTGTTYNWSGPSGFTSITQNPVISIVTTSNAGTYTVSTTSSGCTGSNSTMSVVVNPPPSAPIAGSNIPCLGQTLSLTASAISGATYNWNGPNGFSSALQNPTIVNITTNVAGTYSVTGSVPGCSASSAGTISVIVNPVPSAPSTGSNSPVCTGLNLSLNATASGSPAYSWTGPNNFSSSSQNPVITGVSTAASGTYSVTATENGCTGSAGTVSVTIAIPPSGPVAGNNGPVCIGNDISLTASAIAGVTYSWSGPNGFISVQQNPVISTAATVNAGTYSVSVTSIATGCTSAVSSTTVIVNPSPSAPVISSNQPVCAGQTLSLTCSTLIGATYSWTGPNGFSSALQNPAIGSVSTAASGTYSLSASVAGCPPLATKTISVTINPTPSAPIAGSNSPVCLGNDISLTASSTGATYNWNGPNGYTSVLQNPVIAVASTSNSGTYSVTTTSAAGCTSTVSSTVVTVNPPPTTPITSSNGPICSGQTLSLTSNTISAASYTWSGPNSFTSILQNPVIGNVTTNAAGTYSVIATIAGCGASAAGTLTVTINQTPLAPVAGSNSPVCSGQNLSLTASTTGTTYSWSGPNGFSSSLQSPVINAVTTTSAGTYTVNTTTNGCTSANAATSVTINQTPLAPVAGSNSPVCSGQDLSLTASTTGTTYLWSGPNGFSSALQSPVINGVTTAGGGTYVLNAITNGCASLNATIAVVINQTPSVSSVGNNSPLCSGQTLSLTAGNVAGTTYSWSGPNSFSSTTQNPFIINAITADGGSYSLTITSAAGCSSTVATTSVVINQTPLDPAAASNSPVCSGQTLSLTASNAGISYSWSGPNGFTSVSQNPTIGSVTTLASGIYSVTATTGGCTGPAGNVTVTINQTPANPTTGSNSPICEGVDLSLTASTIGNTTYLWNGPNGFTSTSQNPVIFPTTTANAGNYSVTVTENGCTGLGNVSVTINPSPTSPVAGNNGPVCVGNDISLTASTIAGVTYSWNGPNGFTSVQQNPTISTAATVNAGTYSVAMTSIATGCTSTISTTNVIVNPPPSAPVISSNQPVCSGQALSLTCGTITGATYSWNGPNGFSSTLQNPAIAGVSTAASGTYSLTALVAGCPPLATETISVTINPTPSVSIAGSNSPVCLGNDISLTASSTGATYNWIGPNGFISSSQNPVIGSAATINAGTYSVTPVSVAGCIGSASFTNVTVNPPPATPITGSNGPICSGQTLSLTSNTIFAASYTWSGPNSFTSILQNPSIGNVTTNAAGTYSVIATVPGCTPSTAGTISITINQTPAAPGASSNTPVCSGNDLSLTSSGTGVTYNWNGPNSFVSSNQNPVISPAATSNSGTYSVTITSAAGCTSAAAATLVTINQTPSTPSTGSNSPVCLGQNLSLTAGSSGATYSWTGPNGFSSASQNPVITGVTTAEAGTYSVTASSNGCTSPNAAVSVIITAIPSSPLAGNNSPVCSGQTLSLTASTISGAIYNWNGPNSFTSSSQNPTIINASTAAMGNYSVNVSVSGCSGPVAITSVTVSPTPNPVAGSNSPVCEGNALSLTSSTVAGATYDWSGPNGFTSSTQNPSIGVTATANAGTYTLTVTSSIGCVSVPKTTSVSITLPIVVNAGSNQTVCANNATVMLNGSVSGGTTTGNWSTSGSGSFAPNSTALNAAYNPSAADTAAGIVTLTLTSTNNGGCTGATDVLTITMTNAPTANAGADQTVCANNASVTLNGSFASATGALWSSSGTGIFSPDNATMNAAYTPSNTDTAAGSVTITLTTTGNGLCNPVSDGMIITINNAPLANAGVSTVACKNNPNVPLNGSSSTGSGTWSTPNGTGTFFPNNSTSNATYMSSAADTIAGSVILIFTSGNNGNCNAEDDSITITYIDKPLVNAGNDITVCANNASVSLAGTSNTGSGQWTSNGTGIFFPNANLLNTTYIPSAADTSAGNVMLIITSANNGTCNPVKDTVRITITEAPKVSAGIDQTVCANNVMVTLNGSFAHSSGAIWVTLGGGVFTPNDSTMNATYIPGAADISAGSVKIVLSSRGNGLCNAVNDTMRIKIIPAPVVNTGPDQLICLTNPIVTLNGTSSTGSGQWTTLGSGIFGNSSLLNTIYIPGSADTSAKSVRLVLTSTGNANCLAVTDTLVLNFTNASSVNAGTNQTVCANNSVVALNGSSSTGSGMWSTSGTGTFVPNNSTLNASYVPSSADKTAGTVTLTVTSVGGCSPASSSILITITPAPIISAGSDQFICAGTMTVSLSGSVSGPTASGQWSTSGSGIFTPNNTTLNALYTLTAADSALGQVTLTLSSTNNGNCNVATDQMKIFIAQPPIVNAGNNSTVCGNNFVQLNGTITGGNGTGIWTTPNGSGSFSPNNTLLNASYLASNADAVAGNIFLVLTSTNNGGCPSAADTATIHVVFGPTANAGLDQTICTNNPIVQLNGSVTNAGGGGWITNGSGTFLPDAATLNATYHASAADVNAGVVILILQTAGNGQCNPATDTLRIFFGPSPLVNAGPDILVCKGDISAQLNGSVSGGANTGQWSTLGNGTFSPNNAALNATYLLSTADTTSGGVTLILTSTNNGNCFAVTDTVKIKMTPVAVVNAGNDITVCANKIPVTLNGSVTVGSTTGVWSTSGSGTFSPNDSTLNASYTPSASDTSAGKVVLKLTSTFSCRPVSDSLLVTFTPAPFVNAGIDVSICSAATIVTLNGVVSSVATGGVWSTSGNGIFTPNNSTLNAKYVPGSNDTTGVTLVLTSTGNGQCSAVTDTMKIYIGKKPVAAFVNSQICSGQAMTFADVSTVSGANNYITSWQWKIDGGNFTVQNPSHTYSSAGTDNVALIVTTNMGCSDTAIHMITVHPSPIPAFTYSLNCSVNSVYFTNTSSISNGNIISWNWNFGDGKNSVLQNPVHSYSISGSYNVILSATSDSGCANSISHTVNTSCDSVRAGFTSVSSICAGQVIAFTDTSKITNNDSIVSWKWSFGDGGTSSLQNPSHTYIQPGTDTVVLSVVTNSGASDTAVHIITVHPLPVASYTFLSTCSLDSVYFTNTSSVSNGNIISYSWNFGDGKNSVLQNPVHTYSIAGVYVVSLTVSSNSGCISTYTNTVTYAKGVLAGFIQKTDCRFNAIFTDASVSAPSDSIISWNWNLGDGGIAAVQNPFHTYTAAGTYTVDLSVTTSGGCIGNISNILILAPATIAEFSPSGETYYQYQLVSFSDLSANSSSWIWYFGDGNTDSVQNPLHTYQQNGTMSVMLIAMNSNGCPDTAMHTIKIIPDKIGIPTAFTPNGDGVNDALHVMGKLKEMDWRIYNEWGNEIFHSVDQSMGWDGTYKGENQPAGRYVYTLKGTTLSDEKIDMNGDVTIIR